MHVISVIHIFKNEVGMKKLRNLIDRIFFPKMKRSKNWITYRIPYKRPTIILVNFTDLSDMVLPNEVEEVLAHENQLPIQGTDILKNAEWILVDEIIEGKMQ